MQLGFSVAVALVAALAWELPYATEETLKEKNKQTKKKQMGVFSHTTVTTKFQGLKESLSV